MYILDIEPLDLGADVKAVGLDLVEDDENREPVRGEDAARIWTRVLEATAGQEPWVLDFFSHVDRVRDYCDRHQISYHEATPKSIVVPTAGATELESLIERFEAETFGARAGGLVSAGDSDLERGLASRGVDAYHAAYPRYSFCAICAFEDGSLVLLSDKLWASEVIRRVRPAVRDLGVEVRLPA
ncbi:MAG TPA: hypothetical protein VEJ38_05000 [Candidatus Acidoferrales bacterium]|nr:hypothetical protein [Candidatus Acidoferrales bacterium]